MLSDVMEHFGLSKSFGQAEGFETDHHRQLLKDLNITIHEGGIIALTGIVGSGKTVLLARLLEQLRDEGEFAVSDSLSFTVPRVTLDALKMALYYDLATEKDGDLTMKTEKEERAPEVEPSDILAPDALELLAERLVTPLQIQHCLPRMLEQAYRFGEKPVTTTVVHMTLAPDMHALEPTLTRHGYNVKSLSELLHIR